MYSEGESQEVEERLHSCPCSRKVLDSFRKRLFADEYDILFASIVDIGAVDYYAHRHGKDLVRKACSEISEAAHVLMSLKYVVKGMADRSGVESREIDQLNHYLAQLDASLLADIHLSARDAESSEISRLVYGYDSGTRKENHLAAFVTALDNDFGLDVLCLKLSHAEMAGIAWAALDMDDKSAIQHTYESASIGAPPARKDPRSERVRKIRENY